MFVARPKPYHGYKVPNFLKPEILLPNKKFYNIRKIHVFEDDPSSELVYFRGSKSTQHADDTCRTIYRKIRTNSALNTFKCDLCKDRFTNNEYETCEILRPLSGRNLRTKRSFDPIEKSNS